MPDLSHEIMLYHGSNVAVATPDLSRCAPRKDFGRGFYLTTSRSQAESFARIVTKRANARSLHRGPIDSFGFVSTFSFKPSEDLKILSFDTADSEWLHCIVAHRRGATFPSGVREYERFDVIAGKVANDQTNATLLAYIGGLYGEVGSERADAVCIGLLIPERLEDQVCLRTKRSIACLSYRGSERVWL